MADPKKPDEPIQLSTNDIIGALKQMHLELGWYMNRPVMETDPTIIMAFLERMAEFTTKVPRPIAQQNGAHAANEARAN